MSAASPEEVAAAEQADGQPDAAVEQAGAVEHPEGFFFRVIADDNGVLELTFRKDGPRVMQTLIFTLDYINKSFDAPFPTLGVFLRNLADSADTIDEAIRHEQDRHAETQADQFNEDGQPKAN